jgi:hypothetical protein
MEIHSCAAVRCCAVGYAGVATKIAAGTIMAFAWNGMKSRSARPARKTSLFGTPGLETGRDEKARSVVALSRVPRLAGFAGWPPAVDLYRRLTGLLSGSPPIDTRPQARAKMGRCKIRISAHITRVFFNVPGSRDFAGTTASGVTLPTARLRPSADLPVRRKPTTPRAGDRKTRCFSRSWT